MHMLYLSFKQRAPVGANQLPKYNYVCVVQDVQGWVHLIGRGVTHTALACCISQVQTSLWFLVATTTA